MPKVTVTKTIDAHISQVWKSWDDFANIDRFNPNLNRSFLINESNATGVGAMRQCDLNDGKNYIREKIIDYVPEKKIVVDIYDGTLPLKSATAAIAFRPIGADRTELTFTMDFALKMGPLGSLMAFFMKPQFRKQISNLIEGNRSYLEKGEVLNAA